MDYFAVGGRPVLTPGLTLFNPSRYDAQPGKAAAAASGSSPSSQQPAPAEQEQVCPRTASAALEAMQLGPQTAPAAPVPVSPAAAALLPRAPAAPPGSGGGYPGSSAPSSTSREPAGIKTPKPLHKGFDPNDVIPLVPGRFEMLNKIQDATRNCGVVHRMRDTARDMKVAVKQMPNAWFRSSHSEFVAEHPSETEMPWCDIGCVRFLNRIGFEYACSLLGVYRDDKSTYVVTSLASEGDLFTWCEQPVADPNVNREVLVHPLAWQMLKGVQQLHDFDIVHRDLSLENILLNRERDGKLRIRIIDFGTASTMRFFKKCVTGKASYQAPELHSGEQYDAFLSDVFSLGVTLYAIIVQDYPWLSTRPGGCKCFEYVRKHGFFQYLDKRKLRNSEKKVGQVMSPEVKQFLAGLLAFNPDERLTLGEHAWAQQDATAGQRSSVWDFAWLRDGPSP